MEPSVPDPSDTTTAVGAGAQPTLTFGAYRLLQKVGEGGMGEVWLAEQMQPIRRQVALKIIKAGMDTARVVARFEAERQALALMDHPAIATVFDGGTTPEGRPYFAMEYVKGETITAYCDRHLLGTKERLNLFIQVCEGVQHAHQKGIIHRDLKPSNVLVTLQDDKPVPKIIDFGVAKATTQHLTERTLFTEVGVLIGTPEYMSPEQAELTGLDIDTRTDVYALGVLLYELLTGTLPFDRKMLREHGLDEIRRTIREVDPPRPSTRITQLGSASTEAAKNRHTEPHRLASQLRGDLDWVTMKALEKDRTRRYQTANALAAEIRRYLQNEPVMAGPPSAFYRTKKFMRRHRFGVGAAATLVLLLVAFAAVMALQAQRIARERDRANTEAETAKRVSDFLVGLFEVAQPSEAAANSVRAREILDRGAQQIDRELQSQPEIRAALMQTMGQAYLRLGLYKNAERLYGDALTLRQQTAGPRSLEVGAGMLSLAEALGQQGRYVEAEQLLRDALAVLRGLPSSDDGTLAWGLGLLAFTLNRQAKTSEAELLAAESVALYRNMPRPLELGLATSLVTIGAVFVSKANYAGAERAMQEATEIRRRVLGADHPTTLSALKNLAVVWTYQGQYARTEAAYHEIVAAERQRLGTEHPALASTLNNLGAVLFFEHKYQDAEAAYREAESVARRSLGDAHPSVARYGKNLGQALAAQGKYAEAEVRMREALATERTALGAEHPSVAVTQVFLSDVLRRMGKVQEAEQVAREALNINTKLLGAHHPRTAEARGALGLALVKQLRWVEAEPLLLTFADALQSKTGVEGDLGEVVPEIVKMYDAWGKPDRAAEWRRKLPAEADKGHTSPG